MIVQTINREGEDLRDSDCDCVLGMGRKVPNNLTVVSGVNELRVCCADSLVVHGLITGGPVDCHVVGGLHRYNL